MAVEEGGEIPELICPLTLDIMNDPVTCSGDHMFLPLPYIDWHVDNFILHCQFLPMKWLVKLIAQISRMVPDHKQTISHTSASFMQSLQT